MPSVYLVIKEHPYIYMEIERVFLSEDRAHNYITETFPYFAYYADKDFYAMSDLKEEQDFEDEERYFVMERVISDHL